MSVAQAQISDSKAEILIFGGCGRDSIARKQDVVDGAWVNRTLTADSQ
jgi:hypothetical protein